MTQLLIAIILLLTIAYFWHKNKKKRQLNFIENYQFPSMLLERVRKKHDYLSDSDMQKVAHAMRDYFYICNQANGKMVAMPSEIVDVLWHEFILFTRAYEQFCQQAFGRFLHHTPTEAMPQKTVATEGIKRAWRLACAKEGINPRNPEKLPLLFAIDSMLDIKDGFKYALNCKLTSNNNSSAGCGGYCATHIGCASGCSGASGSSTSDSFFGGDASCGGGCGGGCGGS